MALPYICRFMLFNLFTCPSTRPLSVDSIAGLKRD